MALKLNTSQAARSHVDLVRIVEAVVHADAVDEPDWLEWKSTLDLSAPGVACTIARTVIGLANRDPEIAARACGGLGYIVIGADHDGTHGVEAVDPAKLHPLIERYLGPGGPSWDPRFVTVDGKDVLVVVVEAPQPGDRIHCLRKTYDKYWDGTVYVRRGTSTQPANSTDLARLQERLLARPRPAGELVAVTVERDFPLCWLDEAAAGGALADLASAFGQELYEQAKSRTAAAPEPSELEALRRAGISVGRRMSATTGGSLLDKYKKKVERWQHSWVREARDALLYLCYPLGSIRIRVENLTKNFLDDTDVVVRFDDAPVALFDVDADEVHLPEPPKFVDSPAAFSWPNLGAGSGLFVDGYVPHLPDPEICVSEDGRSFEFTLGKLRPEVTRRSSEVFVLLAERPADGILRGTWEMTTRIVEGTARGTFELPVSDQPIDLAAVLDPRGRGT